MSLDYTAYVSRSCFLSPKLIAQGSSSWHFLFVDSERKSGLPEGRSLPTYCWVVGAKRSAKMELAAILPMLGTAQPLPKAIGICELEISEAMSCDDADVEHVPERYRAQIASATTRYDASTNASGNLSSVTLLRVLCTAIAKAVGGVTEDPQFGVYRAYAWPQRRSGSESR
jgi:hypothetical protein